MNRHFERGSLPTPCETSSVRPVQHSLPKVGARRRRLKLDIDSADIVVRWNVRYPDIVRAFRRHIVVHAIVCLLLTWAAADLLVPQLCSAEQTQSDSPTGSQDHDDCFCCCSHVERTRPVEVAFADVTPVVRETAPAQSLPAGAPRTVYHPPLLA